MLNVTNHAKDRAVERLGFKENDVDKKLNSLMNNAVEVFHNGQGRAFENKQHGIVIITDLNKQNVVTVFHSKGTELSIDNTQAILSNKDTGIIEDLEFRNIMFKKLEEIILEISVKDCEYQIRIAELEISISTLKLKTIKTRKKDVFEKYDLELMEIREVYNELKKERDILSKRMNKLISDNSHVFGFELKQHMSSSKIKRRQFE